MTGAQADVESAQADVEAAQAAVGSRQGDVSAAQADVSAAQQKIGAAQAAVSSGQASVLAAQAAVSAGRGERASRHGQYRGQSVGRQSYAALKSFERVTAPFDGVITARNVDVGALITAGSSPGASSDPASTVPHSGLFGIARTDTLRIQVNVPQSAIGNVKPGQTAHIVVQELPGRVFTGTVARMAGALDAGSRTLLTEVRVANRDNILMPGMYAQVNSPAKWAVPRCAFPPIRL